MKKIQLIILAVLFLCFSAGLAGAASTSVGFGLSRGSSHSTAFTLKLMQKYEPWLETSLFSLSPLAEIGGHAWVPDDGDADTVWGAYLAPGMRFTLHTNTFFQPYLEGSIGGALNTKKKMDERKLGSHALFRTRGSVGVTFGDGFRHRLQGDYIHFSTWGLTDNNAGYNTYGISYGYSF